MSRKLISVVIPSFNRFEYLKNAIDSVMSQTYKEFEIIVINDGSTQEEYYENKLPTKVKIINLDVNRNEISLNEIKQFNKEKFGSETRQRRWFHKKLRN